MWEREHWATALPVGWLPLTAWTSKILMEWYNAHTFAMTTALQLFNQSAIFFLLSRRLQTALLHAAKHNHHLMVADLIHFGANVNAVNNTGKSCLHLSAERGYVRVLEVRTSLWMAASA